MKSIKYIRNCGHGLLLMLLPAALSAQGIQVSNGANLILNGGVKLVLHNAGIVNNGNILTGNSLVFFTGTRGALISGSRTVAFHDVSIDKPSFGFVLMQQDISISGLITLNAGNLLLNTHTLDLGTTGNIFGERSHAQITGTAGGTILLVRRVPFAPNAFNPGNIGLEITSPVAPGFVVIERMHRAGQVANGVQSIERSYNISSQVNTGLNATVRFFYLETELNQQEESGLLLWKGSDVSNGWIPLKSAVDINTRSLTVTSLDHWDRFTAANPDNVSLRLNKDLQKTGNPGQSMEPTARIYPNPSRDVFTMEIFSPVAKKVSIGLYDQQGRMLQQKSAQFVTGLNRIQWNLRHYAAGVYYVVFEKQEMKNLKITKE